MGQCEKCDKNSVVVATTIWVTILTEVEKDGKRTVFEIQKKADICINCLLGYHKLGKVRDIERNCALCAAYQMPKYELVEGKVIKSSEIITYDGEKAIAWLQMKGKFVPICYGCLYKLDRIGKI